jgi:hypothetical protein
MSFPASEEEIDVFLAAFEDGTLPKERWTHAAHVLTGACYVHRLGAEAATGWMRERVAAYNVAVGGKNTATSGYHETITVFWIRLLGVLAAENPGWGRAEFGRLAVARYGEARGILEEFYDFDVVGSERARREWVEPTLRQLL